MFHVLLDGNLFEIYISYSLDTLSAIQQNYLSPPTLFIITLSKVLLFSLNVLSPCETMGNYKATVGICWCVDFL